MSPPADSAPLDPTERALPRRLGDFEILDQLGQGGSGVVYAARHGEREVALKVLRADEIPTPRERERFVVEAQHMARLRHPNVVRIFGVGELPDGRPFLAMERLHGVNLAQRIGRGPLPLPTALELFEQLASSVAALHAAGLIHRDLKAENVMLVDGERRVVLLDFGIARPADAPPSTTTRAGLQRGTPAVMAPERFFGARATLRSDIYELAVVLFAMLTGGLPWRDPLDPKARLAPLAPSQVGLALPAALERALMRAMSATVEERPASVAEFAGEIRRAMSAPLPVVGQGTTEHDEIDPDRLAMAPTVASTTEPMARRRLPRIAAVVFGVAALGGGAGLMIYGDGASGERPAATALAPDGPTVSRLAAPADGGVAGGAVRDAGLAGGPAAAPERSAPPGGAARDESGSGGGARPDAGAGGPRAPKRPRPAGQAPVDAAPPAAPGDPLPWCRKVADLYCTPEFQATEGSLRGVLCTKMHENVRQWGRLPPDGITTMNQGCKEQLPQLEAAARERIRLSRQIEGDSNDSQPAP